MPSSTEPTDLSPVSRALTDRAGFIAGWIAATPGGDRWLKTSLELNDGQLQRLLICRTPHDDRYVSDVSAIAAYIGIEPTLLATALRQAAVFAALSKRSSTPEDVDVERSGVLVAARDNAAEQLPFTQASAGVRELAAATWQAAPPDVRERRDVKSAVVWASQAMVVLLPRLQVGTANRWLTDRGVQPLSVSSGSLRGLLVAWRGHAAIFVDGTLNEAEGRVTIAHEHGHFLLDYLAPRQRVLRDALELLDVIDGYRHPTDADRARAALARVPLGVHTHFLARDDQGGAHETTISAEEDATVYALELLAPFDEVVALLGPLLAGHRAYPDRLAAATAEVAEAFILPSDAAEARAAAALAALGLRPGFFDR